MEYLIFALAIGLIAVFVFCKGMWDQRKQETWNRKQLQEAFGKVQQEKEDIERAGAIRGYFLHHQESFSIDDITFQDLEMNRIFARMDTTKSSAGQEYLYYMLRTPSFSEEVLARRERLIRFFTKEEDIRLKMQYLFLKLGKTRKYSIYDYIGFLDNLGKRSNLSHILGIVLFLPVVGIFYINSALGMAALFGLVGYNIASYLKDKSKIEPYLICFKYVFRAIDATQKLTAISDKKFQSELEEEIGQLKNLTRRFSGLKKSGRYGMHVMGDGGNPLEVVTDYLNMIFHLDLIGFNLMLKQLQKHEADIDEMLGSLGRLEALIAVASYRASLPEWCEPQLHDSDTLTIEGLYHPLIADAVKNDISTQRGVLVTGSNASGKSTFLKAVALNAIFAQTIHTCAAKNYQGRFYRVMSSMALRDNLEGQESYYIVEIKSLKRILDSVKQEGAPVLCFVDEVLRGTNTIERIAASTQILKSLSGSKVLCFAATHDIELTELLENWYENYHFQEQVENGDVFFSYELMPGRAQTRNAIRLLAIMGYDEEIIGQADALAASFLEKGSWM